MGMGLSVLLPRPTRGEWNTMGYLFIGTLAVCYYISLFAWRLALRDTNVQKRMRILRDLGVREPRRYMFVGFFHPFWYVARLT